MKIFISWSRNRSKAVASALKAWISDVFQDVDVWMSAHDIDAGSRWGFEINRELESTNFGILCLTAENITSPWLLFEAGSLAKAVNVARVVPYLFELSPADVGYPLAQFQSVTADQEGTRLLLESINDARESKMPTDRLSRALKKWWPDLDKQLKSVPTAETPSSPQRTDRALLEEILSLFRSQQARLEMNQKSAWTKWMKPADTIDLSAAADVELNEYLSHIKERYIIAATRDEEWFLSNQMERIKNELNSRGCFGGSDNRK
jgi:TIR domain